MPRMNLSETYRSRGRVDRIASRLAVCSFGGLVVALSVVALAGCESEPADPLAMVRAQQQAGDFASTIEPLRKYLRRSPHDAEASYRYGRALIATGQIGLATFPLREAMEDPEWFEPAATQIAQASLVSEDFNEVVEVTTEMLERDPENALALLFRAQARAHWRNDPQAALADANRVLELDPEYIEAYEPKIIALLALERRSEAHEALAEAGRRLEETDAPESTLAWHCSTTATFEIEADDLESARRTYERCLERFPTDPRVVTGAIQLIDSQGDYQRSLEILQTAFDEAPELRFFRSALADRLRAMGRTEEGEALLLEATESRDPRAAALGWSHLAQFYHGQLDHGRAADALGRAVELLKSVEDPTPQLVFQYADALVVSGQLDRAAEVVDDLTVPAHRHMIRGRIAQERGDPKTALAEFDEALRVWPDNPFARYYAALAAEDVGDFQRAIEEYRYALRIDVAATDARKRVAELLIAQGEPAAAYQLLFLEVNKYPLDPEAELLSMFLMGRVANPQQLQSSLKELAERDPARLPDALARGAEGALLAAGPTSALELLEDAPVIDYTDPASAPALRMLIRLAHAAGKPEIAAARVEAALANRPDAATFHAIRGLHLELSDAGALQSEAYAAYQRAVELDGRHAPAIAGLGRLLVRQDPDKAAELFERAAALDPAEPDHQLRLARALRAAGRPDDAAARLDALLDEHSYIAAAAAEQVDLDLERDRVTDKTLERAKRTLRFGGGLAAQERLAEVYARLGRADEAQAATARAQQLRRRLMDAEDSEAGRGPETTERTEG